jgi:hypothetical protein
VHALLVRQSGALDDIMIMMIMITTRELISESLRMIMMINNL